MAVLVESLDQFVEACARLRQTSRGRASAHRLDQRHGDWILRAVRSCHGAPSILVLYALRALARQQAIEDLIWGSYTAASKECVTKLDWAGARVLSRQPHFEIR